MPAPPFQPTIACSFCSRKESYRRQREIWIVDWTGDNAQTAHMGMGLHLRERGYLAQTNERVARIKKLQHVLKGNVGIACWPMLMGGSDASVAGKTVYPSARGNLGLTLVQKRWCSVVEAKIAALQSGKAGVKKNESRQISLKFPLASFFQSGFRRIFFWQQKSQNHASKYYIQLRMMLWQSMLEFPWQMCSLSGSKIPFHFCLKDKCQFLPSGNYFAFWPDCHASQPWLSA